MPDSEDRTCEKIDKLTDAVNALAVEMATVKAEIRNLKNGSKKNGNLDIRTWLAILGIGIGGGGITNVGINSIFKSDPQVQYVPMPQIDYTQPRSNGR